MTLNDSWGYQRADDNWKTPRTVIRNLITCARDGGNYLLNIGPEPDGSHPAGKRAHPDAKWAQWMKTGGADHLWRRSLPGRAQHLCQLHPAGQHALHACAFLAGQRCLDLRACKQKVLSAKMLKTGQALTVSQDGFRTHLTGLPATAPDTPVTTIALECDGVPDTGHRLCAHQQAQGRGWDLGTFASF